MHVGSLEAFRALFAAERVAAAGNLWARAWWAGDARDEEELQQQTGATLRCLPFPESAHGNAAGATGACIKTGRETDQIALFAKAY